LSDPDDYISYSSHPKPRPPPNTVRVLREHFGSTSPGSAPVHLAALTDRRFDCNQKSGVGARCRVELKPIGTMDETVTTWEEGHRIDTENHPSLSVPFNRAETTLTLEPDDEGTLATFDYRYVPHPAALAECVHPTR
jgi:hypothetical protein